MLEYLQRLAWDPTAPVPDGWPHGWYGVLLLFCVPGGVGIPPGVLLGHHDGLGAPLMTVLYFLSDVFLACCFEPLLILLAALAGVFPVLARAGRGFMAVVTRTMPPGSLAGPTGVSMAGFGAGLPVGRALAAAAGFPLVTGWLLAIAGDMLYFALGLASTLWFDGVFGDQRAAAVAGVLVMLIAPTIVHRLRARFG
jgi:hypothetical protein